METRLNGWRDTLYLGSISEGFRQLEVGEGRVEKVASDLGYYLIGQPNARLALAQAVARYEAGLNDPLRPIGSFLFFGPTGVGKTEAGVALADYLFGNHDDSRCRKIDCSTFASAGSITRLTGGSASFTGYGDKTIFDEEFLACPNIIVFDEIEKCHPQLLAAILSITDTGELPCLINVGDRGEGVVRAEEKILSFRKSIIIFTSNIGAEVLTQKRKQRGFVLPNPPAPENLATKARNTVTSYFNFMPEFLGRIDQVILFDKLSNQDYMAILCQYVFRMNKAMREKNPKSPILTITPGCVEKIIAGQDFAYGARDLKKAADARIYTPLSSLVSAGKVQGKNLVCDMGPKGEVYFYEQVSESENN